MFIVHIRVAEDCLCCAECSERAMGFQTYPRVCLKTHCTILNAPLCGILRCNFGNVAPLRTQNHTLLFFANCLPQSGTSSPAQAVFRHTLSKNERKLENERLPENSFVRFIYGSIADFSVICNGCKI